MRKVELPPTGKSESKFLPSVRRCFDLADNKYTIRSSFAVPYSSPSFSVFLCLSLSLSVCLCLSVSVCLIPIHSLRLLAFLCVYWPAICPFVFPFVSGGVVCDTVAIGGASFVGVGRSTFNSRASII